MNIHAYCEAVVYTGKKYGVTDVVACLCMSSGLIFFTLADNSVSPTFSTYGKLHFSIILLSFCNC